jgi:hypothetical protein
MQCKIKSVKQNLYQKINAKVLEIQFLRIAVLFNTVSIAEIT